MESVSCRVCGSLRSKPATAMLPRARVVAQRFDRLVGLGLGGILHLNLEHQMAAALQIEPEMDVCWSTIGFELLDRDRGKPMMPKRQTSTVATITTVFDHQIPLHADICLMRCSIRLVFRGYFEPSGGTSVLTADRAN